MTRRRLVGLLCVVFVACVGGVLGSFAVLHASDDGAMRTFRSLPVFEAPGWMEKHDAASLAKLDTVSRRRTWSGEDAAAVLTAMRRVVPGAPQSDLRLPPPDSTPDEVVAWLSQPGARDLAKWLVATRERDLAWGIVKERLRLGIDTPEEVRRFAIDTWINRLHSGESPERVESAVALLYTGLARNADIRTRLEAARLSDPDPEVRAAVDRGLKHFDRVHHALEPTGLGAECNTCP